MYDFIALDVETANEQYFSICQVGLAFVEKGKLTKTWGMYVNPETNFTNTEIHGISQESVKDAMKFPQVFSYIQPYIENELLVHHTAFDQVAITRNAERYGIVLPELRFFDSSLFVRDIDSTVSKTGFGLVPLCSKYNIDSSGHHDAVNDAVMLAKLLLCLQTQYGVNISSWTRKVKIKSKPDAWNRIAQNAVNEGVLNGFEFVLTGNFENSKKELSDLIVENGGNVRDTVTATTAILIVGKPSKFQLDTISIKHKTALKLRDKGSQIQIIDEATLFSLLELR
jgi:DNA polymerase-3 subunit epsilon